MAEPANFTIINEEPNMDTKSDYMSRVPNYAMAKKVAAERQQHFGFSALDGRWYVGTFHQLRRIGVVEPEQAYCTCRADGVEPCRLHGGA